MKTFLLSSCATLALILGAGCQESTTTGPSTTGRPADVKKLTVTTAQDQSIQQGETDKMKIMINRDNFKDPVKISLNDLPPGVEFVEKTATIPAADSSITLTLKASANAEVGEHMVTVTAEAAGLEKNSQAVKLTVKKQG